MKHLLTTAIITAFVGMLSFAPQVSAQTIEELETQYELLLLQVIQELQSQINQLSGGATVSSFVLPSDQACAVRYNGSDSAVAIQQELKDQGYVITKVDGKVGPETRAAVSAFQAASGAAKIDGIIGSETRGLLSRNSVACIGDPGVSIGTEPASLLPISSLCRLGYTGDPETTIVQQELQDQGYAITKVDGIIGEETQGAVSALQTDLGMTIDGIITEDLRIALARRSLICEDALPPVVVEELPTTDVSSEVIVNDATALVQQRDIIAGVRTTTAGIPDDTAVFTYLISFAHDGTVYVPTNPSQAFEINLVKTGGVNVSVDEIDSIVSSAQKVLREDSTSYFIVKSGDTMSLRTSVQPGGGSYYAELGRFSYTTDDVFTVVNPAMINYGFDTTNWRSETVTLLN